MLRPFIVTTWHGAGPNEMPPDVKAIYTSSPLANDPIRLNVFAFVLDSRGTLVHSFHGVPGRGTDRGNYRIEIAKAATMLNLLKQQTEPNVEPKLPDLPCVASSPIPVGVRMFVRLDDERDAFRSRFPVVELVPMNADNWKSLSYPASTRAVEAESLRDWFVQLYPAGIRTADQKVPFRRMTGAMKLEPAGADNEYRYALLSGEVRLAKESDAQSAFEEYRYALLSGEVRLAKESDAQSAFEGTLRAVVRYRPGSADVHSVRGLVEGVYIYRVRTEQRMKLMAVIESRP